MGVKCTQVQNNAALERKYSFSSPLAKGRAGSPATFITQPGLSEKTHVREEEQRTSVMNCKQGSCYL